MNYIHTDENAVYYECGYSNDNCIYLSLGSEAYLITDGRYTTEASDALKDCDIELIIDNDLAAKASKIIKKNKIKKIHYDPKEWDCFGFGKLKEKNDAQWIAKVALSHKKRIIKTPQEIKMLQKAVRQGAEAFDEFAKMIIQNGIAQSEKNLYDMAKRAMSRGGRSELSFDPIVAIGKNAAKPHAKPSSKRLKEGDLLLFDAGLKYKRYCSDRTRTAQIRDQFGFSRSQQFGKKKIQKAYDAVKKAHDRAITKARSGMRASKIDALARDVIEKAGFGKYFVHSTGHGVGLDIHEMPYISSRSNTKIKDGMVYTIEPGIYIPDQFGIRLEDMVVMENSKARVL